MKGVVHIAGRKMRRGQKCTRCGTSLGWCVSMRLKPGQPKRLVGWGYGERVVITEDGLGHVERLAQGITDTVECR